MIVSNNIFVLSGISGLLYAGSPSARFYGESNYGLDRWGQAKPGWNLDKYDE